MSLVSKTIGLLGGLYNLYALGGTNGGIIVRQKGGTAGTHEVQVFHRGGSTGGMLASGADGKLAFGTVNASYVNFYIGVNAGAVIGYASSNNQLCFNTNLADGSGGASDTGLTRLAAKVLGPTDASTGAGWIQNTAGTARVTANVTNATTNFSNITDLSVTLIAGRKYVGSLVLFATDSVAADGIQFDFAGGAATATSFIAAVQVVSVGTASSTALATALSFSSTTDTSTRVYTIQFSIVCNAGGTLIPRFAQVAHSSGTATVYAGSYLTLQDSPN